MDNELPAKKRRRIVPGTWSNKTGVEPSPGPWTPGMGVSYNDTCLPRSSEASYLPYHDAEPCPGISFHADLGAPSLHTSLFTNHYGSISPDHGTASLYTGLCHNHGTTSPYTSLDARHTATETDTVFGSMPLMSDAGGGPGYWPWLAAVGHDVGSASGVTRPYHGESMHYSCKGYIDPHALSMTNYQALNNLTYTRIDSSLSPGSSGSSNNSNRSQSQSTGSLDSGTSPSSDFQTGSDFQTAPLGQTPVFYSHGYIYTCKDGCANAGFHKHRLMSPPLATNVRTPSSAFPAGQAQPHTSGQDIRYSVTTSATACLTGPCVVAPEAQDARPALTHQENPSSSLGSGSNLGFASHGPVPAIPPAAANVTYDHEAFWPPQPLDCDEFCATQQIHPLQLPLQSQPGHDLPLVDTFCPLSSLPGPNSPSSVPVPEFLVEPDGFFLSASLSLSNVTDMARGIMIPQWPRNEEHSDSIPPAGQAPSDSPEISGGTRDVTLAEPGILVPPNTESPNDPQGAVGEARESNAELLSVESQQCQGQQQSSTVDVNKAPRGLACVEFDFDSTPADGFELVHCKRKHHQLDQPDAPNRQRRVVVSASASTEKKKGKDFKTVDFRSKKTCLRCRVQKLRCQYDILDDAADCRACRLFSKTSRKTIHHIACYRGKLISTVLFRQGGLNLTQRWQGTDIKDVGDRLLNGPIRTIYVKLGLCDVTLELHVVEFHPVTTDVLHRSWHYVDAKNNRLQARKKLLPAFCLHSACRTAVYFEKYVCQQAIGAFVNEGIDLDKAETQPGKQSETHSSPIDVIKRTYKMAMSHYRSLGTDKDGTWEKLATIEKNLLSNLFTLWFAIRNTMGSSFIVGSETLGMVPELVDETYPLFGKVSVPRMITAQCDSIIHKQLLVKYGRKVLQDLEVLIFSNNRRWWWTIYTCTFIFLREASLITADRYRHARSNYGTKLRYSIPKFVEELQEGCNNLLMHWHYFNCKPWPDASKIIHRRQYPALSDEQCELIRDTIADAQIQHHLSIWKRYKEENGFVDPSSSTMPQHKENTPYHGTQATFQWDHSLYWVSQMFEEKWQPHPIYQREKVPDPPLTDTQSPSDSLDISLDASLEISVDMDSCAKPDC